MKLMKSCVVRVPSPRIAKVSVPRVFEVMTGSSGIVAIVQLACTCGSPCMPNCAMKFSITRKKRTSSKNPFLTRL